MICKRVAIVGTGTIGRGWAALFAKAGYEVALYDAVSNTASAALDRIARTLNDMAEYGLLSDAPGSMARIAAVETLHDAVRGAFYVQESISEDAEQKRALFRAIECYASRDAIFASSSSALLPSQLFAGLQFPQRCLVAHPFNPPHLIPLVELVPSPNTIPATLELTRDLMLELGQSPIVIRKAVPGYAANRLQAALINEAMHLVAAGVISPTDLDLCLTAGLGRRWAFLGPFETMDLNADDGVAAYARKFRNGYAAIGADLGVSMPWTDEAIETVVQACRAEIPADRLEARREWRDRILMNIAANPIRSPDSKR